MVATGSGSGGATNNKRKKKKNDKRNNISTHRTGHNAISTADAGKGASISSSRPSSMTTTRNTKTPAGKLFEMIMLVFVLPTVVTWTTITWWKPTSFIAQLFISFFFASVFGVAVSTVLEPVAIRLASNIYETSDNSSNQDDYSSIQNDPSITWPPPTNNAELPLPEGWKQQYEKRQQQLGRQREKKPMHKNDVSNHGRHDGDADEPLYFLNHVGGFVRLIQASTRLSHGLGTIAMAYVMMHYLGDGSDVNSSSTTSLSTIGLQIEWINLGWGFLVGSLVVIVGIFVVEVLLGWIHIIGYCEVARPNEPLLINLIWDVLFHIGVSINEEVLLRGWIFIHSVAYLLQQHGLLSLLDPWIPGSQGNTNQNEDTAVAVATGMAILFQALIFAFLHVNSPGASTIGLINLVVGGTIAALNVVISGGLSFNLGWHFGWNIWMGHLLGLSTSGIPMSAKLVSILPHPAKVHLHGGRFGPEQSPLAPVAYLLGFILLLMIYCDVDYDNGTINSSGIELWKQRLAVLTASSD